MIEKRTEHVQEMKRLKSAIKKTTSPFLKRDYTKAYIKMQKELRTYDRYHHLQCKGV